MRNGGKQHTNDWTMHELEFLRDQRGKLTMREIAARLGRTYGAVVGASYRDRQPERPAPLRRPIELPQSRLRYGAPAPVKRELPARHYTIDWGASP